MKYPFFLFTQLVNDLLIEPDNYCIPYSILYDILRAHYKEIKKEMYMEDIRSSTFFERYILNSFKLQQDIRNAHES